MHKHYNRTPEEQIEIGEALRKFEEQKQTYEKGIKLQLLAHLKEQVEKEKLIEAAFSPERLREKQAYNRALTLVKGIIAAHEESLISNLENYEKN